MTQTYVVQVRPQETSLATRKLREQGLQPWAPEHDGASLTPGYLFVEADGVPWAAQAVQGAIRLLPSAANPLPVPDDQLAVIREVERALHEAARHMPAPVNAAKAALANLLRQAGFTVSVAPEKPGRAHAPHMARRLNRKGSPYSGDAALAGT